VDQGQVVTFQWVLGDAEFGRDTSLLDKIDGIKKCYFMEIPVDTRVWLERPQTEIPAWQGNGRKPTRRQLVEGAPPSPARGCPLCATRTVSTTQRALHLARREQRPIEVGIFLRRFSEFPAS